MRVASGAFAAICSRRFASKRSRLTGDAPIQGPDSSALSCRPFERVDALVELGDAALCLVGGGDAEGPHVLQQLLQPVQLIVERVQVAVLTGCGSGLGQGRRTSANQAVKARMKSAAAPTPPYSTRSRVRNVLRWVRARSTPAIT